MTTVRTREDLALMAHLLRRAGFGATREELERCLARGYEATVEELLSASQPEDVPDDLIRRYHVDQSDLRSRVSAGAYWIYRMATTPNPLREKMALFWHRVFATGTTKLIQAKVMVSQVGMFRRYGMGSFRELLVQLSRDPAMIMWLDNQDNHSGAINENYGREILELFSMGVGNYTEDDIKECSRAFTGWTIANPDYMAIKMRNNTARPYGYIAWQFRYDEADHDDGVKRFLGETGRFNGEDVIDIICKQPATARFIARHLYHFFVADEVPVPQWPYTPPRDPEAIQAMSDAYFQSGYDITAMLRAMFNSDYFKSARFARIKSPAEYVVGVLRLAGGLEVPSMETYNAAKVCGYMGQDLLAPPSVEGWQGGMEWVNTGAYVQRINFASKVLGDATRPGVRAIVERIKAQANGGTISPERLVDLCLDLVGPLAVAEDTRKALVDYARKSGDLASAELEKRAIAMLQLVVTTQEYQLA